MEFAPNAEEISSKGNRKKVEPFIHVQTIPIANTSVGMHRLLRNVLFAGTPCLQKDLENAKKPIVDIANRISKKQINIKQLKKNLDIINQ